ncbi:MAG: ThuA domain-containing protein [Thermoguttaceae bacterium]|jgi:type 1 glutamine amidotransferase|nr:ThuA domain-containing protein [Thermoguttaceae bacterium]
MFLKHLSIGTVIWAATVTGVCLAEPPLRALIIDGQNNHDWKNTTPLLKKPLEETGLFAVDVATSPPQGEDMSGFRPQFGDYDVLVMNYTGDDWPEETRKDLEQYMAGGGGMVVVHAASNAFPRWDAYNEMIGLGGWGGRNEKSGPWVYWQDGRIVRDDSPGRGGSHGRQFPVQATVRVPDHPITRGLPEKFMHGVEELYDRLRGPAKNLTVLATSFAPEEMGGSGREEPVLMTIRYGEGRVFHTVFGHAPPQHKSVAFIATLQRGAEWAATGKVTQPIPDDFPTADEAMVRP